MATSLPASTGASGRAPDRRLRPIERIQRPGDFQKAFKGGRCFRHALFRIHFIENRRELSRIGMVVTRKIGKAVERNRLKRIFREIFRESKTRLPVPADLVIVASPQARSTDRTSLEAAFENFIAWLKPKYGSP